MASTSDPPRLCISCNRPVAGPFDSYCGKCDERLSEFRAEQAEQETRDREYRWAHGG